MEIEEVTSIKYQNIINNTFHIYNSALFNDFNSHKVEKVVCLLFKEKKYRCGIIGGIHDGQFLSPYSAPFGGYSAIIDKTGIEYLEGAVESTISWCKKNQISKINITLPPSFYDETFITEQINVFFRYNFKVEKIDVNHHFLLKYFDEKYLDNIEYNAQKNLRIALNNELIFQKCANEKEMQIAYDIIRVNRHKLRYYLAMSFEQIMKTSGISNSDFFLVASKDNIPVAAAIVFRASKKIVQVIYWGDTTEYRLLKPMNFLAYKIFEYYKINQFEIVDIGPSTRDSIPNYGLINFKKSIGCSSINKFTFIMEL